MKYKNDLDFSYISHLQHAWYANEVADTQDIYKLLDGFRQLGSLMHHSFPIFFIIDYTARQYLLMTDAALPTLGYHPHEFLESGLEKIVDIYQKEDFGIFNKEIFKRNLMFLGNCSQHEHHQHIFSYNYRLIRNNKKQVQLLQRSSYITSAQTGLPLYSIGMGIDISDVKTDTVMVHSIEKNSTANGHNVKEMVERNYFYPNQEDCLLSQREKDVLRYMADGLSSKQIVNKLHISENTIANHRQNMLRKTNTKNVAELVAFACRSKII